MTSFSTSDLKGTAVLIDDDFESEIDKIKEIHLKNIIKGIEHENIPLVSFKNPKFATSFLAKFSNISFLILDWDYNPIEDELDDSIQIGRSGKELKIERVLGFIEQFRQLYFAPIFIISNVDKEEIIDTLKEKELFFEKKINFIHVLSKKEVSENLFNTINDWINDNPPVLLLKIWENSLFLNKNKLFWELYNIAPSWPKILWKNYEKEGQDPKSSLNQLLFDLLFYQTHINKITNEEIISDHELNVDEVRNIIRRTMYRKNLGNEILKPGDIFKDENKYYLNIRPECDTIPRRRGEVTEAYVIEGEALNLTKRKDLKSNGFYNKKTGFHPKISECFLFLLDSNHIVRFDFNTLKKEEFNAEFINKRVYRLLPPYITKVQQRFSSYIGRFGVPRLPPEIEKEFFA